MEKDNLLTETEKTMLDATRYMVEEISTDGGYLWYYLPDLSRQWGEMEAYESMIWLQHPGTVSMGHTFLDAYHATGDEYYYSAAEKGASAIVRGQRPEGGWNYMIDFAGEESISQWYNTIGKNGWRLEEFQHYYGNSTFDDKVTADAARFLLRIYLEKGEPTYEVALEKVIDFILGSQYPEGGWPQRYPLRYDFSKNGNRDYTSLFTFNDDVIWENIHFLVQCHQNLSKEDYSDAITRGMDFYLLSQHSSGGWAQQYDMDLNPSGARSYEPLALLPSTTYKNAMLLLRFYELTGDRKYLESIPKAIEWLELTRLPEDSSEGGRYTHPTFVEPGSNKALYVHRRGSNVIHGYYYYDYHDTLLLGHYSGKGKIDLDGLKKQYDSLAATAPRQAARELLMDEKMYFDLNRTRQKHIHDEHEIMEIIQALDENDRWLTTGAMISHPYSGDGQKQESTDKYATTNVGDKTDTSPYRDSIGQEYISTGLYINNMRLLINYLNDRSAP
ncbi:MAG: pectate lyase [Bacteroidales bacterium]|nr:pectate lyase [Bacteroidales bacterium]